MGSSKKYDTSMLSRNLSSRRSQFALEFLMTYGWAILAVMAVIGALSFLYLGNPGKTNPNTCIFQAGFACLGSQIDKTTHMTTIVIKNSLGQSIYSLRANASDNNFTCIVNPSPCPEECTINVLCNTTGVQFSDQTKLKVNLYYKRNNNGYDQIASGEIYSRMT